MSLRWGGLKRPANLQEGGGGFPSSRSVANISEPGLGHMSVGGIHELSGPFDVDLWVDLSPRVDGQAIVGVGRIRRRNIGTVQDHVAIHGPGYKVLAPFERIRVPTLGGVKGQVDRDGVLFLIVPNVHPADSVVQSGQFNVNLGIFVGNQEERGDLTDDVGRDHVDRVVAVGHVFFVVDQLAAGVRLQLRVLADRYAGTRAALVDLGLGEGTSPPVFRGVKVG